MARSMLTAILALGWTCTGIASAQHTEEEQREKIDVPEVLDKSGKRPDLAKASQLIIQKTNDLRKEHGRGPVRMNKKLTATASYFANYMAEHDEYGHTADGQRPSQRAKKHGYDYCIILENIAYVFSSRGFDTEPLADKFFTGWKESPPHRRNMLDPDVSDTGVAVARSEKTGYYYAVQMFGRPRSAAIEFKIQNRSGETVSYTIGERKFELSPRITRTHTRCRPAEAKFTWPGQEKPAASVKPTNGDTFVVTKEKGQFALKKQ